MGKYFFNKLWVLSCFLLVQSQAEAQDPHFSQYFSSPLTFNPAFTGYFDGTQRVAFNMRNQWANISDPYITGTISFDTKMLKNRIGNNDKWGLGVMALFDQAGGGIYQNNYLALSTGFNKGLDVDGSQSIGLGVQAAYVRNSIDFSKISYGNQYTNGGFDLSVPSGETVNNRSVSYLDLNAGILYNYTDENENQFTIGASIYHILKPKLSFFSGNNQSLPVRYALHLSGNLISGERDNIFLSANLMQQNGTHEIVMGSAYGLGIGDTDLQLYLGGWLRTGDAFYPYLGLRATEYQVGLSYDITLSDLKRSRGFTGSSELSFIYFFNKDKKKGIPCFF